MKGETELQEWCILVNSRLFCPSAPGDGSVGCVWVGAMRVENPWGEWGGLRESLELRCSSRCWGADCVDDIELRGCFGEGSDVVGRLDINEAVTSHVLSSTSLFPTLGSPDSLMEATVSFTRNVTELASASFSSSALDLKSELVTLILMLSQLERPAEFEPQSIRWFFAVPFLRPSIPFLSGQRGRWHG